MYIPTVFTQRAYPTVLGEEVRNRDILGKVKAILQDRSRRIMESENLNQNARALRQNPLNTKIISFQGFGNGHILHLPQGSKDVRTSNF